ncbi:hypothetical protein IAR55_002929 [Kwoniella newhampshirensis]|uniref:Telomere-associated protein Rif1 N-terminal domain-containing protein n=1 Tax=Kwoniella newhampshirensis TaxID=1651941 RepID=A0AAW0Z1G6_9TREE
MSIAAHRPQSVKFTNATPDHEEIHASPSSSPAAALVPLSSSPSRGGPSEVMPLGAKRTVSVSRRAVIFSPQNDTKYFHSDDSIIPSCRAPLHPQSIRAYPESDPITPLDSPSLARGNRDPLSETPTLVRSILKSRAHQIRLAASVEEGTLNNKEAARLLVSGKRPRLLARDSYQLAMLRKAAGEGVADTPDRKGKGRMPDEVPGSDDSTASGASGGKVATEGDDLGEEGSSEEEEEEVEQDGALATGSLINIILNGTEDLLTLEEAYNTLTQRLRQRIPTDEERRDPLSPNFEDGVRIATQPLRDEAPAMVRAVQRDLQRLLGKLPGNEFGTSELDSSPFRDLLPLRNGTPISQRGRFTPSPTPGANGLKSSPTKPARQGYTEAEVRYRRESSGVGAAVLRFLAFTFHTSLIFSCFSEADLQAILEQVMIIPRTPKLPTPNPKRTYYLSILLLAQMSLPSACVHPIKDKILRAVEGAIADTLGAMGGTVSGKEGPSATKKEGYHALTNLLSNYPSIFFTHYPDLLASCLRGMANQSNLVRYKAAAAACAFARAKITILTTTQSHLVNNSDVSAREVWNKTKTMVQKSEFFVVSHLKSALKMPGKSSPIYGKDGEKKTEWHALEQVLKDSVGSTTDVHWACAAWATLVTLIGSAYGSSGLSLAFDHIMDRSLQPSTNVVRPLLARAAWNHAIHAYLSSGYASSFSDGGHLVRSYKPFAASSQQTVEQRTATLQLPVSLALSRATDKMSYARALVSSKGETPTHNVWQRSEKTKKLQWLITCGLGATAVVYAYTGMAIHHDEQPAKEMSVISGLPSSDGVPMPDLTPEEKRLPRLDNAWEKVVHPMLRSFFSICGVDPLTVHGWTIFDAITSSKIDSHASWSLDRLLTSQYMDGVVFSREKDADFAELLEEIEREGLHASDIPSWGKFWAAKRLGRLLVLFDEALSSIHGLNKLSSVEWVKNENETPLIPLPLSNVWSNLLHALTSINIHNAPPTPLFLAGLQAVTRHVVQVFNRDPKTYVAIGQIDEKGECIMDENEVRIGITTHLLNLVIKILGEEVVGTMRLRLDQSPISEQNTVLGQLAFGGDSNGNTTLAGAVLGQLLRSKTLSAPVLPANQAVFKALVQRVLEVGCAPGFAGKLLGDITNAMPFLFEECEEVQLDIWRLIATKWTQVIDLQPSSAIGAGTNHTGALLVSLLSGPFRGRDVTSYWHQNASQDDLAIWQSLLRVTVLRFRAKRFGANFGVLEALAGHLTDFLEGEKTSSTTITLSCLAAAASWMSFTRSEHSQSSPWHIDENYVPVDFLTLVSNALEESYPGSETQAATSQDSQTQASGPVISPAVSELLDNLRVAFERMPSEYVHHVLEPTHKGVAVWLEDRDKIASTEMNQNLDNLYVTLLTRLGDSIVANHLPAKSDAMNSLVDIFAPRLSRASSSSVPFAFQAFWQNAFGNVQGLDYSDDVAGFLKDVLAAVPGMIAVPGLSVESESQMSEEESQAKYPHALAAKPAPQPMTELMTVEIPPATTGGYDADISQSVDDTQPQQTRGAQIDETIVEEHEDIIPAPASPRNSEASEERHVSDQASPQDLLASGAEDVFGPAALTKKRATKRRGRKGEKAVDVNGRGKRALSEAQSLPEAKRPKLTSTAQSESMPEIKAAPLVEDSDEECIVVQPSPGYFKPRGMVPPSGDVSPSAPPEVEPKVEEAQDDIETETEAEVEAEVDKNQSETPAVEIVPESRPRTRPPPIAIIQPHSGNGSQAGSPTLTRPSLLSSASRWLSRVPSFPFFAPSSVPTTNDQPVNQVLGSDDVISPTKLVSTSPERVTGKKTRKRKISSSFPSGSESFSEDSQIHSQDNEFPGTLSRTSSASSINSVGQKRSSLIPVVDLTERPVKRKRSKSRESIVPDSASDDRGAEEGDAVEAKLKTRGRQRGGKGKGKAKEIAPPPPTHASVEEDEEDELLLSPESARRRKREEEEAIRVEQARAGLIVEESQISESISGRFADAPNDPSPSKRPSLGRVPPSLPSPPKTRSRKRNQLVAAPTAIQLLPPQPGLGSGETGILASPAKRTAQQNRILSMVDEAAKAKEVIENLDYQGVKALLKNLNSLREAAEERMMSRLEELRSGRRT